MPVNVRCPNSACGKLYLLTDEEVGTEFKCPACGHVLVVPASAIPVQAPTWDATTASRSLRTPMVVKKKTRSRLVIRLCLLGAVIVAVATSVIWLVKRARPKPASTVTSEFRGKTYHAEVSRGGVFVKSPLTIRHGQRPPLLLSGVVSGTMIAKNEPYALWRSIKDSHTRCRILDYDPPMFLIEGDLEMIENEAAFLAPGAVIENAMQGKLTVPLAHPRGGSFYELAFGETVEIDENGEIKSRAKP